MIAGACVSLTVTVNEQLAELLDASLTEQLTVVVPFGNVEPEAGLQAGVSTPGQLSVAVAFEYVTTAVHRFGSVLRTTLAGQLIAGGCVSFTVTVNEQLAELLDASPTVQLTVVVPFWNVEPEAGLQAGVPTPGQLSVAVAFEYVTTAVH
ncbi:MAG: hypothetical protein AABN34_04500 [Acidobacteriota bacterium]